ncbi:MAG TPA: hypothetical protein VIC58_08770 [Actinomycetota bacterium]
MRNKGHHRLMIMILVSAASLVACGGRQGDVPARVDLGIGSERWLAEDLAALIAHSDAVVVGSAIEVVDGRFIPGHDQLLAEAPAEEQGEGHLVDGRDPHQFVEVHLKVDEVMYGTVDYPAGSDVVVFEEGFGIPPLSSLRGDRGVYFLELTPDSTIPPSYHLVTSQGRFLFEGRGVVPSNVERGWEESLATLSPEELNLEIAKLAAMLPPPSEGA